MKVKLLLDGDVPRVPPAVLKDLVRDAGMTVTDVNADIGLVVGGDGRFSRYGRTEDIPLLFVGVRSKGATGSKAHLAQASLDGLSSSLRLIRDGHFEIVEHRRLSILLNDRRIGEAFTDVYLQRGNESTCIRYNVRVSGPGTRIQEAAIGDGVVVATQAGATGYYSYPDRIKGEWMDPAAFASIGKDEVGICHVSPTFTERKGSERHPLRYQVPWGSKIELSLFRRADARLYGAADDHGGIRIRLGDMVEVLPGKSVARIISLQT